jgi:hypothetical protein
MRYRSHLALAAVALATLGAATTALPSAASANPKSDALGGYSHLVVIY